MIQFRIENLIVNILDCLDGKKVTRSYLKNAETLLSLITVQDKTECLNILKVLQHIRNSLHSNGVHNNATMSISINGCEFDFRNGQKVQSASWSHIIVALAATFEVLEKILSSSEVKAIPQPIRDHYIEQN
ncbi:hypothetical protein NTE_02102 [Candidatus Nitrososphaera evergladensis SR1]|uniref:Uncharacterized protein n=1 Tax=Candidatus Nitrososphaera evergladensis SR1 TaxID=1459636 RepID=A0A075MTR1_9ARCH|nr:hypothetical protein NTE_02102 [Candidatus Nitrososphaera evergladensis SR1]